jgi:hypothetical protein
MADTVDNLIFGAVVTDRHWGFLTDTLAASKRCDNREDHSRDQIGYHIQTSEGALDRVTDFMMDDKSWAIRHLVDETGHWFSGKEIAISPKQIDRISHEESKVFVKVTKEAILETPEYHVPPLGAAYHDTRNFD